MRRVVLTLTGLGCVLALLVFCYKPVILGGEQFAYRDAGCYYYPLHLQVQREWKAGRWPLWDPSQNGGMPLLGNPTAAVLYPGKLVFALFPYALAARLYVVVHTVLAFVGMLALGRTWRLSWTGSMISGLCYAFGAPVLFQYCNVIYLVGAAWMPFGLRGAERFLRQGRLDGLLELALALAMQVLGGDPQAAYLTALCGGVLCRWPCRRDAAPSGCLGVAGRLFLLAAVCIGHLGSCDAVPGELVRRSRGSTEQDERDRIARLRRGGRFPGLAPCHLDRPVGRAASP